jgi:hypothetical protein
MATRKQAEMLVPMTLPTALNSPNADCKPPAVKAIASDRAITTLE